MTISSTRYTVLVVEDDPGDSMLIKIVFAHCDPNARVCVTRSAEEAIAHVRGSWSDADSGLRWLDDTRKLELNARPKDVSPGKQRSYQSVVLDDLGPERWEPYKAPKLEAFDSDGDAVTLADFEGRNVVLVFYLGEQHPPRLLFFPNPPQLAEPLKSLQGL